MNPANTAKPLIVVLCRPPDAPDCKTRLARDIGRVEAVSRYRGMLESVLGTVSLAGTDVRIAVAGEPLALAPLAADRAPAAELVRQRGASFGERQAREVRRGLDDGYRPVVLVASDLPALSLEAVTWCLSRTGEHDVAIVPAHDGGYSLLASRVELPVLAAVPMSTTNTCRELSAALDRTGYSRVVAPFVVRDVDQAGDLDDPHHGRTDEQRADLQPAVQRSR
ncbi:DUF2064 domain-containing protein [Saccharothrix sp. AJ9571]|nr:DUF2064 domain-containing protein [Saccharothrix sp. AJ9571]